MGFSDKIVLSKIRVVKKIHTRARARGAKNLEILAIESELGQTLWGLRWVKYRTYK